jgi:hypothetical protein
VAEGQILAEVHARIESTAERAVSEVLDAYTIGDDAAETRPVLLEVIE